MTTKANVPLLQRMLSALRSGDAALIKRTADAAEEEVEAEKKRAQDEESEAERKETKDALASLTKTVDALVAALAKTKDGMGGGAGESSTASGEATGHNPTGDEEEDKDDEAKKKTADAMRDTVSRAEILVPGFKVPTADSAAKNMGAVVAVRRKVLADAIKTADGEKLIQPLLAGKTVTALTADAVSAVFVAASELARAQNNASGARHGVQTEDGKFGAAPSVADINTRNAAFWATRK